VAGTIHTDGATVAARLLLERSAEKAASVRVLGVLRRHVLAGPLAAGMRV
jgi:hypothetical protein